MERWTSERRRKRSLSVARSLERQVPRKRVKRHGTGPVPLAQRQEELESDYLGTLARRLGILDPLWAVGQQWHLANDDIRDNSINVTGVWASGTTGKGVTVAIVDDGLDMHSDDLADNFYAEGSWDYNDATELPEPRLSDDQHGTRCAGEIAAVKCVTPAGSSNARRNDVCGVGVAHSAKVAGIRILSASISDADEASALNYGYQHNDIYSCSWGPPDDGQQLEAPSPLIVKAFLNGIQNGRGGKGSLFVFASGNGGAVDDQCNMDGYTNSIYSVTVGAIDRKGARPFYSEACTAMMVVTYSSGSGDHIHTTDVGKNKCAHNHGGTSAAAPIAAGIYALVLQARPELTWRDIQHLSVNTAVPVNLNDPDWTETVAGRLYNHKFGFGKLDAGRIVEAARTHQLVKPQAWWESEQATNTPSIAVDSKGAVSTIEVSQAALSEANFEALEHITVTVDIEHTRRGNVEVEVTSPNGIKSVLARPRRYDDAKTGVRGWQFMSVKHWGENAVGQWTIKVHDQQTNNQNGTFNWWKLSLWGESRDPALAKLYKLPGDDQLILPGDPHMSTATSTIEHESSTIAVEVPTAVLTPTATMPEHHTKPTKSYARPTEHLPDDHGMQTGELHPPRPTEAAEEDIVEEPSSTPASGIVGTFSGMKSLLKSSTWLFASAAVALAVVLGLGVAFLVIWMRRRRAMSGHSRGYFFEAVPNEDMHPMTAVGPGGRTRALYDAFALDDSDDEDDEQGHPVDQHQRVRTTDDDEDDEELVHEHERR